MHTCWCNKSFLTSNFHIKLHKIINLLRFLIQVTFLFMPVCKCMRSCAHRSISPFRKLKWIQNALKGQENSASPVRLLRGWIRSRELVEDEPNPFLCVSRQWIMCRTHKQPSLVSLLSLGHMKGTVHLGFNCQLVCCYINAETIWHKSGDCHVSPPFNGFFSACSLVCSMLKELKVLVKVHNLFNVWS